MKSRKNVIKKTSFTFLLLLGFLPLFSQTVKITGTVTDNNGEPLIGVSVGQKGTSNGVMTDIDGNYALNNIEIGKSAITFTYVGYTPVELAITSNKRYDVVLKEVTNTLDEVVVVGYATQKKANLTGAVATIDFGEAMSSRPIANASSALAGLSAGVQIQQSSGKPGGDGAAIRIRGTGTLNNNSPLVLVDGVEWDMNNVNTNDIESITILKDAASASIYGSRAANGVILVTTKKGKGKPKINYSYYGSIQKPQNKLSMVSDYARHMELINEGAENMDRPHVFGQSTIESWRAAQNNPNELSQNGVPNYMAYPNTDWFEEIMGTGFSQQHNISISGSSDKVSYLVSLGYVDNEGVMNKKGLDSGLERFQFRTNLEAKLTNWFTIGTRLHGLKQSVGLANISRGFEYLTITTPGIYPGETDKWGITAATEESTNANNIFMQMGRQGLDDMFRGNFTLYGKISPMQGLSLEASYNYAPDFGDYANWGFKNGSWDYVNNVRTNDSSLENSVLFNKSFKRHRENSEILARYNNSFGDHEIGALAGFTTSIYRESSFGVKRKGMSDWSLHELNTASEMLSTESSATDWALVSYLGRINYAYKSKYLFEANLRYDGSSRFSSDSRWGLFPSFSAGWRLNEESFMNFSKSYLSNLKIRASWGKLGNNMSGNYDWQATYSTNKIVVDGKPTTGLAVTKLGNSLLEWESTSTANLGIDFGFLNNRLSGEVDIYNKATSGILFTPDIPLSMGYVTGATENIAKVRNKGVELSMAWRDEIKDFSYQIGGNFSFNHNKIIKYRGSLDRHWVYDEKGYPIDFASNYGDVARSGFGGIIVEDRMIGEMYIREVYKGNGSYDGGKPDINAGPVDGMIRTEQDMQWVKAMISDGYKFNGVTKIAKDQLWYGDLIYADANGDGNYGDTNDLNLTGTSSQPKYNFGINLSVAFKGFDFYMLWAGSAGFDLYWNNSSYNGTMTKNGYAISNRVADDHYFYDPTNPDDSRNNINGRYPRLTDQTQRDNGISSSFWKYKGDYIKLKNLQLGYTLPTRITNKFFVDKLRLYVSGENLLTITDYPGLDPEMGTSVNYPLTQQIAFGVQVAF